MRGNKGKDDADRYKASRKQKIKPCDIEIRANVKNVKFHGKIKSYIYILEKHKFD